MGRAETTPHPRKLEDAAMQLALAAEDVDEHIMDSGLAYRRQRLRDEILNVKLLVEQQRDARRAPGSLGPVAQAQMDWLFGVRRRA